MLVCVCVPLCVFVFTVPCECLCINCQTTRALQQSNYFQNFPVKGESLLLDACSRESKPYCKTSKPSKGSLLSSSLHFTSSHKFYVSLQVMFCQPTNDHFIKHLLPILFSSFFKISDFFRFFSLKKH